MVTNTMLSLAAGSEGSLPSQSHSSRRQTVVKAIKSIPTVVHELHSVVLSAHLTKGLLQKIIHQRKVHVTKHCNSLNQH